MDKSLSDQIYNDMLEYTSEIKTRAHKVAKDVQREMLPKIGSVSPVRQYSTHTQKVSRIVVHRNPPAIKKAVHQVKAEKYQPGYFRIGWTTGNIKLPSAAIYGVRNKNMPNVTHLLNFNHAHYAHGRYTGETNQDTEKFVDNVQNWAEQEFNRRLSEFIERK